MTARLTGSGRNPVAAFGGGSGARIDLTRATTTRRVAPNGGSGKPVSVDVYFGGGLRAFHTTLLWGHPWIGDETYSREGFSMAVRRG